MVRISNPTSNATTCCTCHSVIRCIYIASSPATRAAACTTTRGGMRCRWCCAGPTRKRACSMPAPTTPCTAAGYAPGVSILFQEKFFIALIFPQTRSAGACSCMRRKPKPGDLFSNMNIVTMTKSLPRRAIHCGGNRRDARSTARTCACPALPET